MSNLSIPSSATSSVCKSKTARRTLGAGSDNLGLSNTLGGGSTRERLLKLLGEENVLLREQVSKVMAGSNLSKGQSC